MNINYALIIFFVLLSSCSEIEDYSYDKGKLCFRYRLSNNKDSRTLYFDNLSSIDCRIKADVKYVRLKGVSDSPFCRLEACPEILDRVSVFMDASGRLVLDYSKCIQDHRLPVVSVTIGAYNLEEVFFLGRRFYSTDTITSKSGTLTLKLKYRRSHFDVTCSVPMLRLENSLVGENFIVSGLSDSVYCKMYSNNRISGFDLRSLTYRSLHCVLRNEDEYASYMDNFYAGAPDFIYYTMFGCYPFFYRGTPEFIRSEEGEKCETIKLE